MRLLNELVPQVQGRPAVILGGAPSLPHDLAQLNLNDAVYFSANHHGAMIRECDYIVYVDPQHQVTGENMQKKMSAFGLPTISPVFGCDYRMPNWNAARFLGNSGMHAIWAAVLLGANPIIVTGMECYQGGVYWHDETAASSSAGRKQSFFDFRLLHLKLLCRGANVRAVTPSMQRHFKKYDPTETIRASTARVLK